MTREFLIGLAMFAPALWGQTPARPEFEVASVKVNASGGGGSRMRPGHGSLGCGNMSLKQLIGYAYDLPTAQISGPGWTDSARFDIDAKGNGDAPESQMRLMMQSLLEDRFHLEVHRETKEGPVYFLTVMRGGLKADRADAPPTKYPALPPGTGHAMMQTACATMAELAAMLTNPAGRPVVDRTGIEGRYQVRVWYGTTAGSDGPDPFTALQEQVGLKLESGRGPVETLVVDAADKVPTEN